MLIIIFERIDGCQNLTVLFCTVVFITAISPKIKISLRYLNKSRLGITRTMATKTVLPPKLSEGPKGLGDPDDRTLRKVEVDVMIPKLIREKAKTEKCTKEVAEFEKCCKDSSLLMVVKCRKQNSILKDCLGDWYKNEDFRKTCTEEYLNQRSEYRRTGIKKPIKRA